MRSGVEAVISSWKRAVRPKGSVVTRAVAIVTALCFIQGIVATPVAEAMARDARAHGSAAAVRSLERFMLPHTVGRITDARYYGSRDAVVAIQDLHCHPEVQKNIARILGSLDENWGVKAVHVEGGIGSVDTSWAGAIGDLEVRDDVIESLITSGELTGAEYFAITKGNGRLLAGVEDAKPYLGNLVRLNDIMERQSELQRVLAAKKKDLRALEGKYLTGANASFEKRRQRYREGSLNPGKYYVTLAANARKAGVDMSRYPGIEAFMTVSRQQKDLAYGAVSSQMKEYLLSLRQTLPYGTYATLIDRTDNLTRFDQLYGYLAEVFCQSPAYRDPRYGELRKFFDFIRANQTVDPLQLVEEEEKIVRELHARYSRSEAEREVTFLVTLFECLEKYLSGKISYDDYRYFARHRERFELLWAKYLPSSDPGFIATRQELFESFYRTNLERNESFLRHIFGSEPSCGTVQAGLRTVSEQREKLLESLDGGAGHRVVVMGGFHTEGFAQLLREKRISYLIITPNVTGDTGLAETLYERGVREQGRILKESIPYQPGWQTLQFCGTSGEAAAYVAGKVGILLGALDGRVAPEKEREIIEAVVAAEMKAYRPRAAADRIECALEFSGGNTAPVISVTVVQGDTASTHRFSWENGIAVPLESIAARNEEEDHERQNRAQPQALGSNVDTLVNAAVRNVLSAAWGSHAPAPELPRIIAAGSASLGEYLLALFRSGENQTAHYQKELQSRGVDMDALATTLNLDGIEIWDTPALVQGEDTFALATMEKRDGKNILLIHSALIAELLTRGPPQGRSIPGCITSVLIHEEDEYESLNNRVSLLYRLFSLRLEQIGKPEQRSADEFHAFVRFLASLKKKELKAFVQAAEEKLDARGYLESIVSRLIGPVAVLDYSRRVAARVITDRTGSDQFRPRAETRARAEDEPAAILAGLRQFITRTGRKGLRVDPKIVNFIGEYATVLGGLTDYPVEGFWSFLKAVVQLEKDEEQEIVRLLKNENKGKKRSRLVDAILLMTAKNGDALLKEWLKEQAPNLQGRTIYDVSAEISHWSGGLGPVMIFHGKGKHDLGADVVFIEPRYQIRKDRKKADGSLDDLDYGDTGPTSLDEFEENVFEYSVTMDGKDIKVSVSRGRNKDGVTSYLIKDVQPDGKSYYTKALYFYGLGDGKASWEEFSAFFCVASAELIKLLENERRQKMGSAWKSAVVHTNDGQTAPLTGVIKSMYADDEVMRKLINVFTTHTYGNRRVVPWYFGVERLKTLFGITDQCVPAFLRIGDVDFTSGGIRLSDVSTAVSKQHRDDVAYIDPTAHSVAVTNGAVPEMMAKEFRAVLREHYPEADVERPRPEQIEVTKTVCKERLNTILDAKGKGMIDPDRLLITFCRRLVEEKAGRRRAFTRENIWRLVESGANVVLFGADQGEASVDLIKYFTQIEAEINAARKDPARKLPGRFIFVSTYTSDEKIALLAASNLQVQDSDRGTGAAEYSEEDISANGGLEFSPPYNEGVIKAQGIPFDEGGNTVIPRNDSPQAYLEAFLGALNVWNTKRNEYYRRCAVSVRLNRIQRYLLTSAAYLREYDSVIERRNDEEQEDAHAIEAVARTLTGNGKVAAEILNNGRHDDDSKKFVFHVNGSGQSVKADAPGLKGFYECKLRLEKQFGYTAFLQHLDRTDKKGVRWVDYQEYILSLFDIVPESREELRSWFTQLNRSPATIVQKDERLTKFLGRLVETVEKRKTLVPVSLSVEARRHQQLREKQEKGERLTGGERVAYWRTHPVWGSPAAETVGFSLAVAGVKVLTGLPLIDPFGVSLAVGGIVVILAAAFAFIHPDVLDAFSAAAARKGTLRAFFSKDFLFSGLFAQRFFGGAVFASLLMLMPAPAAVPLAYAAHLAWNTIAEIGKRGLLMPGGKTLRNTLLSRVHYLSVSQLPRGTAATGEEEISSQSQEQRTEAVRDAVVAVHREQMAGERSAGMESGANGGTVSSTLRLVPERISVFPVAMRAAETSAHQARERAVLHLSAVRSPDEAFYARVRENAKEGTLSFGVAPLRGEPAEDMISLSDEFGRAESEEGGILYDIWYQEKDAAKIFWYAPVRGPVQRLGEEGLASLAIRRLIRANDRLRRRLGLAERGDGRLDIIDLGALPATDAGERMSKVEGHLPGVVVVGQEGERGPREDAVAAEKAIGAVEPAGGPGPGVTAAEILEKLERAAESVTHGRPNVSVLMAEKVSPEQAVNRARYYRDKMQTDSVIIDARSVLADAAEQGRVLNQWEHSLAHLKEDDREGTAQRIVAEYAVDDSIDQVRQKRDVRFLLECGFDGIQFDARAAGSLTQLRAIIEYAQGLNPDLQVSLIAPFQGREAALQDLLDFCRSREIVMVCALDPSTDRLSETERLRTMKNAGVKIWYQFRMHEIAAQTGGAQLSSDDINRTIAERLQDPAAWSVAVPEPDAELDLLGLEDFETAVARLVQRRIESIRRDPGERFQRAKEQVWNLEKNDVPALDEATGRELAAILAVYDEKHPESFDAGMRSLLDGRRGQEWRPADAFFNRAHRSGDQVSAAGFLRGILERGLYEGYSDENMPLSYHAHRRAMGWALAEAVVLTRDEPLTPVSGKTPKSRYTAAVNDFVPALKAKQERIAGAGRAGKCMQEIEELMRRVHAQRMSGNDPESQASALIARIGEIRSSNEDLSLLEPAIISALLETFPYAKKDVLTTIPEELGSQPATVLIKAILGAG